MFTERELEIYKSDMSLLSESENIEFNKINVYIEPYKHDVKIHMYFNINLKDVYNYDKNKFENMENVTIYYYIIQNLDIISFINFDKNIFKEIFNCDVYFKYTNNSKIEYNKKLSDEFESNLQSTFESIACALNDW